MTYLFDVNVLIALTIEEHEHHVRAAKWLATVDRVAICPTVEGALVRFLVRVGESARVAAEVLRFMHADQRCEFWADSVSYAEVALAHIHGHRQVTDAYLVALAGSHHDARLATLDRALVLAAPDRAFLVPAL